MNRSEKAEHMTPTEARELARQAIAATERICGPNAYNLLAVSLQAAASLGAMTIAALEQESPRGLEDRVEDLTDKFRDLLTAEVRRRTA